MTQRSQRSNAPSVTLKANESALSLTTHPAKSKCNPCTVHSIYSSSITASLFLFFLVFFSFLSADLPFTGELSTTSAASSSSSSALVSLFLDAFFFRSNSGDERSAFGLSGVGFALAALAEEAFAASSLAVFWRLLARSVLGGVAALTGSGLASSSSSELVASPLASP